MYKNYFKIALRHILKNKSFSLINIFGLSIGMACAILIMLWITDEVNYNKSIPKYERLYQIEENQTYDGKTYTFSANPGLLSKALKEEIPEVANATRMDWGSHWLFADGDKTIYKDGSLVDDDFFKMFEPEVIYGNREKLLPDENSIVITESTAKALFPEANPVGKYVKVNSDKSFEITGVIKDAPANSSLKYDFLASFSLFEKENAWWNSWTTNGMQTFVELKSGTDINKINKKLHTFIYSKNNEALARPFLFPMEDWRLRNNFVEGKQDGGRIEFIRLFAIIAILLVLIACINFMNLATARSEQRIKEVGVRKVIGAERFALMKQFISESLFMSLVSLLVACVIVMLFLPSFNELTAKHLSFSFVNPLQWFSLILIAIICGFVSGSYPSIYLSSFSIVSIFKGIQRTNFSGAVLVRRGLVITQFVISIVLIISTIVIFKQIEHVKTRQLGYNKQNLILLKKQGNIASHSDAFKQDLLSSAVVANVSSSSQTIISKGSNTGGFTWSGKDLSKEVLITIENADPDYIRTTGMKLIAGRDFHPDVKSDSLNIIINETFAKIMHKKYPVGEIIRMDSTKYHVIGEVKDFVFNNFYTTPDPYILFCDPSNTQNLFVRIKPDITTTEALAGIEAVFKKDNSGYPFEYKFMDDEFDKLFKSEVLIAKLSRLFAIITILVSCLGLFGLAAYTAERRTKEIGIRKVMGATVGNMIALLSKDFLRLVFISILIASPLAWYIMNKWLTDYVYRINIQLWMFLMAGILAIAISMITVSAHAIKAAIANPVKSLRTE